MPTIRNKTGRPISIHVFGGKKLHLGPGKLGDVSTQTTEMPSFRRLIDEGSIEVVGDTAGITDRGGAGNVPSESTHGHKPPTVVMPKGNR